MACRPRTFEVRFENKGSSYCGSDGNDRPVSTPRLLMAGASRFWPLRQFIRNSPENACAWSLASRPSEASSRPPIGSTSRGSYRRSPDRSVRSGDRRKIIMATWRETNREHGGCLSAGKRVPRAASGSHWGALASRRLMGPASSRAPRSGDGTRETVEPARARWAADAQRWPWANRNVGQVTRHTARQPGHGIEAIRCFASPACPSSQTNGCSQFLNVPQRLVLIGGNQGALGLNRTADTVIFSSVDVNKT